MKKEELITKVSQNTGTSEEDVKKILEYMQKQIQYELNGGDEAVRREKEREQKIEKEFPYSALELQAKEDEAKVNGTVITVNCKENDSVDIRCGGPEYLGYRFLVEKENEQEMKEFIHEHIQKNNQPLHSIFFEEVGEVERREMWTKTDIARCMYKGFDV